MTQNNHTKTKVLSSFLWKFMERGGTQGIQFIVQIVLARLLLPEDYGIIALVVVFTSIAGVFVQSGLNTALIQKKDADEIDFSSVFYLSLFLACSLYIILFFTAPFIAAFYKMPQITSVFRVLSITLIFGAFNSIQNAIISRKLQFKRLFFSSTGAILISGMVGIFMAYSGFGVWALVAQQIANRFMVMMILWFTVKWRPHLVFSFNRVKSLFSFGWKLLMSGLLNTVYNDLYSLIIGRIYEPAMLGFYNRGQQFPKVIVSNFDGTIQSVMLPVLSSQQDNRIKVKNMMRRGIITSSFVIFPAMIGLIVTAEPVVKLLLTDKWLPSVPFLQIYCVIYMLMPIHTSNLQAINALGRSDIFLKLEIIKKVLGLIILIITVQYGVYAIAFGGILSGILSSFINAYPNKQLLNYSYKEQWNDIMPSLVLSVIMGIVVYSIKLLSMPITILLFVQMFTGVVTYVGMAKLFKLKCFNYLLNTLSDTFLKRKKEAI
ncbi:MAG: lipopolysaccharide biosynthesis protein [Firmicutes bacterium]|nr:lipopolysaccharide biosynthesis protein [Bacillota bacterium]